MSWAILGRYTIKIGGNRNPITTLILTHLPYSARGQQNDSMQNVREGTLRIVGDIRLNINELSNMMGWVIYISKTVVSNEKLLFSTSSSSFKS